jgi:hypothetical protein
MMIRPSLSAPVSVAVAAILLTSACSSGGDGKSAAPEGPGAPGATAGGAPAPGSDGRLDPPAGAGEESKKEYTFTNEVAACMKQAGFTYVPYVAASSVRPQDSADADRDYQRARESRAKYGFGAFAAYVYPGDPMVPGAAVDTAPDPNDAAYQALPADRKAAWDLALNGTSDRTQMKQSMLSGKGCIGQARTKVYGDQAKIDADGKAQAEQARVNRQDLNGDAELVRLAQAYAACLRTKGYNPTSTAVTEIRTAMQLHWFGQAAQLTRPAGRQDPGSAPTSSRDRPSLAPDVARAQLTQEIQAALADIDCGKDFRAAYFPKLDKMPGAEGLG